MLRFPLTHQHHLLIGPPPRHDLLPTHLRTSGLIITHPHLLHHLSPLNPPHLDHHHHLLSRPVHGTLPQSHHRLHRPLLVPDRHHQLLSHPVLMATTPPLHHLLHHHSLDRIRPQHLRHHLLLTDHIGCTHDLTHHRIRTSTVTTPPPQASSPTLLHDRLQAPMTPLHPLQLAVPTVDHLLHPHHHRLSVLDLTTHDILTCVWLSERLLSPTSI